MKQLILIRHAKSSWNEIGKSDFERSLNARGKHDAPMMGQRLASRLASENRTLDAFLASSACRAEQTARLLAAELAFPSDAIDWRRALYLASPTAMLDAIRALPDAAETVALLAHNPGITELAERLCREPFYNVPTCGVVTFSFASPHWSEAGSRGQLVDFDYPKKA